GGEGRLGLAQLVRRRGASLGHLRQLLLRLREGLPRLLDGPLGAGDLGARGPVRRGGGPTAVARRGDLGLRLLELVPQVGQLALAVGVAVLGAVIRVVLRGRVLKLVLLVPLRLVGRLFVLLVQLRFVGRAVVVGLCCLPTPAA